MERSFDTEGDSHFPVAYSHRASFAGMLVGRKDDNSMRRLIQSQHIKRNFSLNFLDGISFVTGMIFLSPESVLPVYLERLGASTMAIFALLAALFITHSGGGVNIPAFFDLTAKTIPLTMRGRLFAFRNLGSYLIGLAAGGIIGWILSNVPYPANSPLLMVIESLILMSYLPAILFQIKPPTPRVRFSSVPFFEYLLSLRTIPKSNPDFSRYILGRVFFALAFTSYSYYAVHLVRRFSLHESEVGLFTVIIAAVFILANPVLGVIADRWGHLVNHHSGAAATVIGNLSALFAPTYALALVSIAMGALTLCTRSVSQFALTVEFGLNTLFRVCLVCSVASFLTFLTVKEPRNHCPPTVIDAR